MNTRMKQIAVLTDNQETGRRIAGWTEAYCAANGVLFKAELYDDCEEFYNSLLHEKPSSVILALSGVTGLNEAEHLRSLWPECGFIWCSNLDFALHAYRLHSDYFMKMPPAQEDICEGLRRVLEKFGLPVKRIEKDMEKDS